MRQSKLLMSINHQPAEVIKVDGITGIKAAYKAAFRRLLNDGYRSQDDTDTRFTVTRNNETIEAWIESEPVKPRK